MQSRRPVDEPVQTGGVRPDRLVTSGGVALVVVHNLLIARGIGELGTLAVNLGMAAGLVVVALRTGWHRRELGLELHRRGLLVAAVAGASVAGAALVAAGAGLIPADAGASALSAGEVWFRLLVAIPIGTAMCEEVIFRGVLLAATDRAFGRAWSTVAVSGLFGLWHVAAETARTGALTAAVTVGVVATGGAASTAVLCPLRRRTGGLAAPVAVHAATNVSVFLAVLLASGAR